MWMAFFWFFLDEFSCFYGTCFNRHLLTDYTDQWQYHFSSLLSCLTNAFRYSSSSVFQTSWTHFLQSLFVLHRSHDVFSLIWWRQSKPPKLFEQRTQKLQSIAEIIEQKRKKEEMNDEFSFTFSFSTNVFDDHFFVSISSNVLFVYVVNRTSC